MRDYYATHREEIKRNVRKWSATNRKKLNQAKRHWRAVKASPESRAKRRDSTWRFKIRKRFGGKLPEQTIMGMLAALRQFRLELLAKRRA